MFNVHSKIHLQNQDVQFLEQQVKQAARSKLTLHLPEDAAAVNNEEDEIRKKVEESVEQFISQAFEMSRFSLVVDDRELGEADSLARFFTEESGDQVVEPFDFGLNERLRKVYYEVEAETTNNTRMRAQKPLEVRQRLSAVYDERVARWESEMQKNVQPEAQKELQTGAQKEVQTEAQTEAPIVDEAVVRDYEESLQRLQELKQGFAERADGIEKLKELFEYIEKRK